SFTPLEQRARVQARAPGASTSMNAGELAHDHGGPKTDVRSRPSACTSSCSKGHGARARPAACAPFFACTWTCTLAFTCSCRCSCSLPCSCTCTCTCTYADVHVDVRGRRR